MICLSPPTRRSCWCWRSIRRSARSTSCTRRTSTFPRSRSSRAFDWQDAHNLLDAGVPHVYRETLDTSLRLGADALRLLGFRCQGAASGAHLSAPRRGERAHADQPREDRAVYQLAARQRIADLERIFRARPRGGRSHHDDGWDARVAAAPMVADRRTAGREWCAVRVVWQKKKRHHDQGASSFAMSSANQLTHHKAPNWLKMSHSRRPTLWRLTRRSAHVRRWRAWRLTYPPGLLCSNSRPGLTQWRASSHG